MTKQHFIAAASEIKNLTDRAAAQVAADVFCSVALQFNARFDRARFLAACGF
jgi:hypothetical protein